MASDSSESLAILLPPPVPSSGGGGVRDDLMAVTTDPAPSDTNPSWFHAESNLDEDTEIEPTRFVTPTETRRRRQGKRSSVITAGYQAKASAASAPPEPVEDADLEWVDLSSLLDS
ncbi:MAG: hypothetical protein ACI9MR_003724 [Myxococcota bacterium]|jgi:hypothetical protein